MNKIKNTIRIAAFAAVLFAGATQAQTVMVGGEAMFPKKNIVENAVNSKDHATLVAAVKAAGLVETLQSKGPFTVFARKRCVRKSSGWYRRKPTEGRKQRAVNRGDYHVVVQIRF